MVDLFAITGTCSCSWVGRGSSESIGSWCVHNWLYGLFLIFALLSRISKGQASPQNPPLSGVSVAGWQEAAGTSRAPISSRYLAAVKDSFPSFKWKPPLVLEVTELCHFKKNRAKLGNLLFYQQMLWETQDAPVYWHLINEEPAVSLNVTFRRGFLFPFQHVCMISDLQFFHVCVYVCMYFIKERERES